MTEAETPELPAWEVPWSEGSKHGSSDEDDEGKPKRQVPWGDNE